MMRHRIDSQSLERRHQGGVVLLYATRGSCEQDKSVKTMIQGIEGMNRKLGLAIVLTSSLCCSPAMAGDLLRGLVGCGVPDCVGKWCCDDYCPKQEPCVCVPLNFCCDDYCQKQEPCVCVPLNFCCDDYCPKCPPRACSPSLCENLKCGPPRACASCTAGAACTSCETAIAGGLQNKRVRGAAQVAVTGADADAMTSKQPQSFWGRLISHRKTAGASPQRKDERVVQLHSERSTRK